MAYIPTFGDWNSVYQTYGYQAGNAMQQQGIPLSQVGQYVQSQLGNQQATYGPGGTFNWQPDSAANVSSIQNNPIVMGPQGIEQSLAGLIQFGQGGGGGPAAPPNPYSAGLVGNPMYSLSQLGAAAQNQNLIVNPNPTQNQINPQSGVFSGPQTPQMSPNVPTAPKGPWSTTPGIFGGPATVPPPSGVTNFNYGFPYTSPGQILPGNPYGGAGYGGGRQPFGTPIATPPPAPNVSVPSSGIGIPPAPTYGPNPTRDGLSHPPTVSLGANPTTPGTSTGSIALQNVPAGIKANSGGSIPGHGNTDTVPAVLTPGEYVINKDAAQKLGRNKLDALNNTAKPKKGKLGDGLYPAHMQTGGEVQQDPAYQWALNMLPEQERQVLQTQGVNASGGMNPLVMQAQKDLQNLIQQYSSRTSATKPTPTATATTTPTAKPENSVPSQQVGPQAPAAPSGSLAGMQIGGPGPADTAVDQANQALQARYNAGGSLTIGGNTGLGMDENPSGGMNANQLNALAGGIGAIGGAWSKAFGDIAKQSWQNIPEGAWANPQAYAAQEQSYYNRFRLQPEDQRQGYQPIV